MGVPSMSVKQDMAETAMLLMETSRDRQFRWWVATLICGLALVVVTRAYYASVFLPQHHGSTAEAARRITDFVGWWAFVRSAPGLVLHLATAACFVTSMLLLILRRRA